MYRVAIDVPVENQVQRVFVPAGGVSTSLNTNTNDVYGTVSGEDPPPGTAEEIKIYCRLDLVADGRTRGQRRVRIQRAGAVRQRNTASRARWRPRFGWIRPPAIR